MMDQPELSQDEIAFVGELVRSAGHLALQMREGVGVHMKSGPHDLVTDADLKISHMIIADLCKRFPEDMIVSEEDKQAHVAETGRSARRVWFIDPIDGTQNYVRQDGQYSSMIGLVVDGRPHHGWIYQPSTRTVFAGGPGLGAWKQLDGHKPIAYRPSPELEDRLPIRLMMGWGDRRRHPWITHLANVRLVPSESLGLKIVKILEDTADLFVSLTGRVKLWDTAAPAALALGNNLDVGTAEGRALPYPFPALQHGSSVIIGRPGAIAWAARNIEGHSTRSVPKPV